MEFNRVDFEEWVQQGLKISHGLNLDILPDCQLPSLLPRAPMAFAFVTDSAAVDSAASATVEMPAMIPLPVYKFSVKTWLVPRMNRLRVSYKATWRVRFVKRGHICDIFIAVPAPAASGYLGVLNNVKIEIPDCSIDVKLSSMPAPTMLEDVYFIERDQVDGGAEVCAFLSFHVDLFPSPSGVFSFNIPLCFPFYAKGFLGVGGKPLQRPCFSLETPFSASPFKIKLYISTKKGQVISDCSYNFPLQAIMQNEECLILLKELEGPDVEWPEGILTCSVSYVDEKAAKCDRQMIEMETVEPPEKRVCLGPVTF